MKQEIIANRTLFAGKFIALCEREFRDDRGRVRHWESVDRVNAAGAVFMLARITPGDAIALIRQFRPPTGRLMLEFPAGLIDPGETPAETAVRELYEETGLSGEVVRIHAPGYSSPGLSGEHITMVEMRVDGEAEQNRHPVAHQEDSECIELFQVPLAGLGAFVAGQEELGVGIDSKIYTFLSGLNLN